MHKYLILTTFSVRFVLLEMILFLKPCATAASYTKPFYMNQILNS